MNQKKRPLQFALALGLSLSWLSILPLAAYAGRDSADPAGFPDSTNTVNDPVIVKFSEPDADVTYDQKSETLETSEESQSALDAKLAEILSNTDTESNLLIAYLKGENSGQDILASIGDTGVTLKLIEELLDHLQGLVSETNEVDLDQLDESITAFNMIIKAYADNPTVLENLKNNSEFMQLRQVLLELRETLRKRQIEN